MKRADNRVKSNQGKFIAETGGVLLVLSLFFLFAVYQCGLAGWKLTEGGEVYANAFISGENTWLPITGNAITCYTVFLSFLLSLFGNHEGVVLSANIVCFLLIMALAYRIGRMRKNFTSGLLMMLVIGTVAVLNFSLTVDKAYYFYCSLAAVVFLLCENYDGKNREIQGKLSVFPGLFLGLILGLCIYVDPLSVILLFVFVCLRTFGNKRISAGECWRRNGILTVGVLVSVFGTFGLESYLRSLTYEEVLQFWWTDRIGGFIDWFSYITYFALILLALMGDLCMSREKKEAVEEKAVGTEAWENAEKTSAASIETKPAAEPVKAETVPNTEQPSPVSMEKPTPKPVQYIENPLPIPKKHVKKEMGYAFEPPKELMHYDYNNYRVDDDYDLKEV